MAAVRTYLQIDDVALSAVLHTLEEYALTFDTFSEGERILFIPKETLANLRRAEARPHVNVGLLVALGLGVGAVLGLALARRSARQSHVELSESVEELKERTQRVLNELSENVAGLLDQTRTQVEQAIDSGRGFAATQVETLQETIIHGAEES